MPKAATLKKTDMKAALRVAGSLAHAVSSVLDGATEPWDALEVDAKIAGPIPAHGVDCGIQVRPYCRDDPGDHVPTVTLTLADLQRALHRAASLLDLVEQHAPAPR